MPLFPTIRDFAAHGQDSSHYLRLGDEWGIAVADVVASTKLAAEGRDKDVNFAAAAVIAVLGEVAAYAPEPAACQFGGDGAVAAIPPDRVAAATHALAALGYWAENEIGVPLRVGLVSVGALRAAGLDCLAALHDFGNGNAFGLFLGAGVPTAEKWVKADARWRITPKPGPLPGLDGVSCRWRPVPASRGVVLSIIIDPTDTNENRLSEILASMEAIIPTATAAPLGDGERLQPRALPTLRSLFLEGATRPRGLQLLAMMRAIVGNTIITAIHKLGGKLGRLNVNAYRRACALRSDYRKQEGGPRFVLDLTEDEAHRIEALLNQAEADGLIHYGTARSDATTMTCLVGDFSADRHIHFVDGSGLGFWRASVVLKGKLQAPTSAA